MRKRPTHPAIYARLSQDRNGDSLGIDRQRDLMEAVADVRGWPVPKLYGERNISAYSGKKRPSFDRLIADIKAGVVDGVLVVDEDRLSRRLGELNAFYELCADPYVPIVTLSGEVDTTTADGVMRAHITGAVAQNASAKESERLKRQRAQAAKLGLYQGGVRRYGYTATRTTTIEIDGKSYPAPAIVEPEARIVRDIAERLLRGESARSIVLDLNDRKVPTAKGGEWTVGGLLQTITSPHVAAIRTHHGEEVAPGAWEPILDRATHEKLAAIVNARKGTRGRPAKSLLGGIARCGRCREKLHQTRQRSQRIYRCQSSGERRNMCKGVIVDADALDEFLSAVIVKRFNSAAFRKALARRVKSMTSDEDIEDPGALEAELATLAAERGEGRISPAEWRIMRDAVQGRLDVARSALQRAADDSTVALLSTPDLATAWPSMSIERQRTILGAVVGKLAIGPTRVPGSNVFDPKRIDVEWLV